MGYLDKFFVVAWIHVFGKLELVLVLNFLTFRTRNISKLLPLVLLKFLKNFHVFLTWFDLQLCLVWTAYKSKKNLKNLKEKKKFAIKFLGFSFCKFLILTGKREREKLEILRTMSKIISFQKIHSVFAIFFNLRFATNFYIISAMVSK